MGIGAQNCPREALVFESGNVGFTVGTYDFFGTGASCESVGFSGIYPCIRQKTPDEGWKCVLEINSPTTEPMEQMLEERQGKS